MKRAGAVLFLTLALAVSAAAQTTPASEEPSKATLDLEWEVVEDAIAYEVQLTPAAGGEPLRFIAPENKLSQSLPVGVYRLQIRSKDKASGYYGPWSESTEVEVTTKIVELLEPLNGAEISEPKERRREVMFRWKPMPDAEKYALKLWSEDIDQSKEYDTRNTSAGLLLPTGHTYFWQVTYESAQSIGYRASPKTYSFTLLGKQLVPPVVSRKINPHIVKRMSWTRSPGAQFYKAKLMRRALDETEWHPLRETEIRDKTVWTFEKLTPGAYRIEVTAHAKNRVSSDIGSYEFVVKPTETELMMALRRADGAAAR